MPATYAGENHITAPARNAEAAVADTDFANGPCRSLYVGTGGNVTAVMGGASIEFTNVSDGEILPIVCTQITSASTASNIVALF